MGIFDRFKKSAPRSPSEPSPPAKEKKRGMTHPDDASEADIEKFFEAQGAWANGAWDGGRLRELVDKDPTSEALTSTFAGQEASWYEQCIRLASRASCGLCGKYPCEDARRALVTLDPKGTVMHLGVCAQCAAPTAGDSKMKAFYRAWYAVIADGVHTKTLGIHQGMGLEPVDDILP